MLDIGAYIEPNELKHLKWQLLKVGNKSLKGSYGFGSMQMSQNEILVFGGVGGQTYIFDINSVAKKGSTLNLMSTSDLKFNHFKKAKMCSD